MSEQRRPPYQDDDVRQRLVAVARKAFASRGYAATTVRDITAAAGANIGAVNYHFGSKELLYHAVLQDTFGPLGEGIRAAAAARDIPPLDRVERVVRAVMAHMDRYREMPPIMMREIASGGELAEPIKRNFGTLLPVLTGIITEGQQDGSIRAGDPVLLALSTIAQPVYFNVARPVIRAIANVDPSDERVVAHLVATVRAALESRP